MEFKLQARNLPASARMRPATTTETLPVFAHCCRPKASQDEQTQAAFRVKDLDAEVAALRSRGVKIEEYDQPGLKTVNGIADVGFARFAWFIDPGKNCVGVMQLK